MPRDRANLRTDIWGDQDWRNLSLGAQWLYEYLLTTKTLSYVGVADWRPVRISKMVAGVTGDDVRRFAAELAHHRFVVLDDETEEIFVRSFLRHDGLLQNPNLWKSVSLSFSDVSSPALIGAVAREVTRLHSEYPEGFPTARGGAVNPWASGYFRTLLDTPSPTPIDTPTETPSYTPSERGSDRGYPTTTATSTSTEASLPTGEAKLKETVLPKDWAPTAAHLELAKERGVDILSEADSFRLHAETHDRRAARWNSAFTTWLKKAKPGRASSKVDPDAWMYQR